MSPILALAFAVAVILPLFVICRKTGLDGWISLIAIIPYFGPMIVAVILARSRWPAVD